MFEVPVKGIDGSEVGKTSVSKSELGGCVRYQLLKDVVVAYDAHARVGTAAVKTRGMIAGTTKKKYRQKGTGRARHGSGKANIFRGGGVVHGPMPRNYGGTISRKARRKAAASALFSKFKDGEVIVVDTLSFKQPKTSQAEELLANVGVEDETVLVVLPSEGNDETVRNVFLSLRNLAGVSVQSAADVNARHLLRSRTVVFSQESLKNLTDRVGHKGSEDSGDE